MVEREMALASPAEVTVRELRDHLAEYLRQVRDGGEIVVTVRGEPVARLVAPEPRITPDQLFGIMKGQIHMAPDFDEDDPDMIAAAEDTDLT
jgi:prevent-host-death family protein